MRQLAFGLWIGREWRRSPLAWLLGLVVVLLGPVCVLVLPVGIIGTGDLTSQYIDSIWYVSTYLGAIVGLSLLARGGSLWAELGPARQSLVAAGALAACCLLHGLLAMGALRSVGSVGGIRWLPALFCAGHWSAIGTFAQRTRMKLGAKWLVLSGLGWWIPALLSGMPGWDRLHWFLGPDRHFEAGLLPAETSLGLLVDTMPIVAWWVAAALLPTRSAFRQ